LKISFICPVYNKKKFLPKVLKGIFDQIGSFSKEYIFIDDGSNDGSLNELKKLTKNIKNIKILYHKNKGPAFTTQKGINQSTGDYIKLVGGDDFLLPNCTLNLLNGIRKTKSVAIFSKFALNDNFKYKKNWDINLLKNLKIINDPLPNTLLNCYSGTSPTLYCAKSIRKSKGCNTKLFVEDFSLALELSKLGNFAFIDNISSIGPKNDENRIMVNNEGQLFHDYNAAIYYFLKKNDLNNFNLLKKITNKCLGRSEKFGRRILKKTVYNKMNFLRLKLFFNTRNNNELIDMIKESCLFFYDKHSHQKIRYKIK